MEDLLNSAAQRAARYLASLENRRVAPAQTALEALCGWTGGFLPGRRVLPNFW